MGARATCRCGWTGGPYSTAARARAMADKHVCPTDDGVRRATRRHRCARCGFSATYEDAGSVEARYWFSKHSCQKQERLMLRSAMAEAREALIDRTPKPCLHKLANHQHGQRATYVLDRCRCLPCAKANSEAETHRERQKAYGRYNKYVPAGPVREHVRSLMDAGLGLKRIVVVAGVPQGTLWKLVYGKRQADGTQQPSRRVTRETAEKLYAIDPAWNGPLQLADGARVPAHGTVLRIRALVALGWSQSKLADRLGIQRSNFRLAGAWEVTVGTARAVAELYDELSMTLPPHESHRDRIAYSRARRYAADRGWLPPLALDDDRLDDPGYEPWFEHGDDVHPDTDLQEAS